MRDEVLRYIRQLELMKPGDRVLAAVSGGADSVALLRLLIELRGELGIVLAVGHFNHLLRGADSEADEAFVADLANQHTVEFFPARQDVAGYALANRLSLETAGRSLRYEWLGQKATENKFGVVATAHTLDDQAETVLMKFFRGAGTKGMGGIYPRVEVGAFRIVRPLLKVSRAEIEAYLVALDQAWREDESNLDRRFLRNRMRHELLPLVEREYNPNIRQVLYETAEINRAEEEYWARQAGEVLQKLRTADGQLRVGDFAGLSLAMQRRVLKLFLELKCIAPDFEHVERLRRCALGELTQVELAEDWVVCRRHDCLMLEKPAPATPPGGYSYLLPVPGEVPIPEIGCVVQAVPVPAEFAVEAAPGTLLRAELLGPSLQVRNWQHGDRYHPAHSSSEEKLKRLFAEKKIPAEKRATWPVVVKGEEIVWAREFRAANAYHWHNGDGDAVKIECIHIHRTV